MKPATCGGASLWRAALDDRDPFADVARAARGRGPGWQRATGRSAAEPGVRATRSPQTIDARPVSVTVGQTPRRDLAIGQRVFHEKFGMGSIVDIDGNKLEVAFDNAGLSTAVVPVPAAVWLMGSGVPMSPSLRMRAATCSNSPCSFLRKMKQREAEVTLIRISKT